jgi:glycosyltransferase involved in cell wall biosynthesis
MYTSPVGEVAALQRVRLHNEEHKMLLSIVIPLLNEAESLPELYAGISAEIGKTANSFEVIFVDDGSTDDSYEVLKTLHDKNPETVRVVRFSRNFGKAAALSVGIEKAKGDVIITMDADLQDDPVAIPDMLAVLDKGYDVVSGWKKKRFDPVFTKNLPSKFFNWFTSLMSGVKLHDFNCGFKAYRAPAAKTLEIYGERHRYLPALAHWNGFKVTEVVVPHHPRKFGKTKYGISRFINGPFDLITLMFLRRYLKNPLHFFGRVGLVFGLAGCAVLAYFGCEWIVTRQMHIRPLMLLSLGAIFMGIQFVSIGLVGEMITSTTNRNFYTVRDLLE